MMLSSSSSSGPNNGDVEAADPLIASTVANLGAILGDNDNNSSDNNNNNGAEGGEHSISARDWIVLGLIIWISLYALQFIVFVILPDLMEIFWFVMYPVGLCSCLILQQKLDVLMTSSAAITSSIYFQRFGLVVKTLDRDEVCVAVLALTWVIVLFVDDSYNPSSVIISLFLVIIFVPLYTALSLCLVWIASRRTYKTFSQWKVVRDVHRKNQVLLRGGGVVALSVVVWYTAYAETGFYRRRYSDSNQLVNFIVFFVDTTMGLSAMAGLVLLLLYAQKQDWSPYVARIRAALTALTATHHSSTTPIVATSSAAAASTRTAPTSSNNNDPPQSKDTTQ